MLDGIVESIEKRLSGIKKLNKLETFELQSRMKEIAGYFEIEKFEMAESEEDGLFTILDFLYQTRKLTLDEHNDLCNLVREATKEGKKKRRW